MKRLIPYVIVFVLGFVVCAWTIHHFFGWSGGYSGSQIVNVEHPTNKLATDGNHTVKDAARRVSEYVVNIDTIGRPRQVMGGPGGFAFAISSSSRSARRKRLSPRARHRA